GRSYMHAMAVVARGFLVGHLLGAHLIQAFGTAEAREGVALGDQLVRVLLVDLATLALPVRAVRAANVGAFIPLNAQPAQRIIDLLFGLAGRAQLVGVLDTQDELTTVLAGEAEVEQRDISGADMRVAGRRRRDTGTNSGHEGSRKNGNRRADVSRRRAARSSQGPRCSRFAFNWSRLLPVEHCGPFRRQVLN